MKAKQLTVFVENRQGRLIEILNVFKKNNINIITMSLADTTEYGLLRVIVNDPEKAKEKLVESGFSTKLTDIFIIEVPNVSGSLLDISSEISKKNLNIEYMYGLSITNKNALVAIKLSDNSVGEEIFSKLNVKLFSNNDL